MKGYNYHIPPRPPPSHHDDIFVSISRSQPHSTWWWWWDVRIRQLVWTQSWIIFVLALDVECRDSHHNLQKIATECQISLSLDVDSDSLVIRAKTHLHSIDQSSSIFYPPNQPSTSQDPVSIVQHWSGAYLWYRSNTKTIWPKSAWSRRLRSHPRIISAPSSRPRTEHCPGFDLRTGLFHNRMTHSKTLKKVVSHLHKTVILLFQWQNSYFGKGQMQFEWKQSTTIHFNFYWKPGVKVSNAVLPKFELWLRSD